MVLAKDVRAIRAGGQLLLDPGQREIRRRVADGMHLPSLALRKRVAGSVWAVAMVKNEADIVGDTLDHLLRQGVDGILVVDNGSSDGTRDILESRSDDRVHVGSDSEPAYFQATKMRYLARWAAKAGADWVVPFDADEWWYGAGAPLADTLRHVGSPIASAVIHNAFPGTSESSWRLDTTAARLEKVAYRTFPTAALHHGNHGVTRPGRVTQDLRILHFPWRSIDHFRSKVSTGSVAIGLTGARQPGGNADHWRDLGEASSDELTVLWNEMLAGRGDARLEWRPCGELVQLTPTAWADRWDPDGLVG